MGVSKLAVENFLKQKRLAVVGVSRSGKKFGNAVLKELKEKGYETYAVNPAAQEIDGEKCYPNLKSISQKPEGVVLIVPPEKTEEVVKEAAGLGIKNIWMQQGSESKEAIEFCKTNNINTVYGECIMMFADPVNSFHKFHKFIWKIFGKLPK